MVRTSLSALLLGASSLLLPAANAHQGVYWSLGIGSPGVVASFGNVYPAMPPPYVYVAPPPVAYPPAVVYYSPWAAPYSPGYAYPRVWYRGHGWRGGWRHDDDDR